MDLRKLLLGFFSAMFVLPVCAQPDNYPQRPIKLVVPWPGGGNTDGVARLIAENLAIRVNQPVVVENKPGANGILGATVAARSKPDGYTLMLALPETNVLNPVVYKKISYSAKDFDAVSFIGVLPFALVAKPSLKANTIPELVKLAKEKPGSISAFSWGVGSTAHTAIALLEQAADISLLHVPYPGTAQALTQLIGGQGDLMFLSAERAVTYAKQGKVKILGVTSPKRIEGYPDIPTFSEQGLPQVEVALWYGIVAPAQTPAPIKDYLAKEIQAILQDPLVLENLRNRGMVAQSQSPAQFSQFLREEDTRWSNLIKNKKIHVDN
ncbi:Bug family tripartite tricarboxylate transporter substrate binding protein [Cupriavidus sp. PET2-C1]